MNRFYEQKKFFQWTVALIMLLVVGIIFYYWLELIQINLLAILLLFLITPVAQFLISPIMKLTGAYKYLSPMLLVYSPSTSKYDLHNGTSFDYLFFFKRKSKGSAWQSKLLIYYLDGLLEVINELENNVIPETIEIRGSSYFFSERTAQRLGFEIQETGFSEKFNIIINYLDLFWMYSLSKGKIHFPKLKDIKTATTTGQRLKEKKPELLKLRTYLINRSL
ncbi:MAG: hypothetical protein RLO81_06410 [Fulvivirga sp.]|uniref:hypothetical protein n=1 Tax=Fulvivirga sp. TaxID=1931237 RepID=UPI0032F08AB6